MINITPIVEAIIALIAVIITTRVIPYIKSKTSVHQQTEINGWVKIAVEAAEQIFKGQGRGKEKKDYVLSWLNNHSIALDEDTIDAIIESAVFKMKNGVITIVEGDENS